MIYIDTTLPYSGVMDSCIGGRQENQDSCGYCPTKKGLLLVVCDGMGGGPSGKLASSIAIQEIIRYVENTENDNAVETNSEILTNAIQRANSAIYSYGLANSSSLGMGTTVIALMLDEECATIAHVGDSRCYQMRSGKIIFKTSDHSVVADLVRKGKITEEQARISPNSNIITRVLGVKEVVEVDIDVLPYEKKDRFYLCSDGVWGAMPETYLAKQFYRYPNLTNILESTSMLVDEIGSNEGGHHDNHTLIIIETQIGSNLKQKMSTKHKRIMLGLAILLALSLLFNLISVFSRENNVAKIRALEESKDSIICRLEKENAELISSLRTEIEKKSQVSDNKKTNEITIPEALETYLNPQNKRNLEADLKHIGHSKDKAKDVAKKNTLDMLKKLKKHFVEINEGESYNKLIDIVKGYKNSDLNRALSIRDNVLKKHK